MNIFIDIMIGILSFCFAIMVILLLYKAITGRKKGFRAGMTINVNNSDIYDSDYTIEKVTTGIITLKNKPQKRNGKVWAIKPWPDPPNMKEILERMKANAEERSD